MLSPSMKPPAEVTGPMKVLVVDDEPDIERLVTLRFRKQIALGSYRFAFAPDGLAALDYLAQAPDTEAVVTDINMPRMGGLELLEAVAERYPTMRTVVVSAYGDMTNIRAAMNRGAFDFLIKPLDFADAERTIERCVQQVRSIRQHAHEHKTSNILKQFVDEEVVEYARTTAGGGEVTSETMVDRTVVFVDICSFTSLSERNEPRVVLGLLNSYFDAIVSCIVAHRGHIDKFIGDAVMATFDGPNAAERAVVAAAEAAQAIRQKRGAVEQQVGFFPNVSAGIHCGPVIAGPVGASVVRRLDYTVIGDVVNTAARLQHLASPGEVVLSAAVKQRLPRDFVVLERGVHTIRGKAEPVMLFCLRPADPTQGDLVALEPPDEAGS